MTKTRRSTYLSPDSFGVEAGLDQGRVIQVQVIWRHPDDGSVLVMQLLGHQVHTTTCCMIHAPVICPCCTEHISIMVSEVTDQLAGQNPLVAFLFPFSFLGSLPYLQVGAQDIFAVASSGN